MCPQRCAIGAAEVLYGAQANCAAEFLVLVVCHPPADRETSERAQQVLVRHGREVAWSGGAGGLAHGAPTDLDAAVSRLLGELATSAQPSDAASVDTRLPTARSSRPLTERGRA